MRDVDNGGAVSAKLVHDAQQPLRLSGGQRRRRLVENQDFRFLREGTGDLDLLVVGDGKFLRSHGDGESRADMGELGTGVLQSCSSIEAA
ncbi:hypothetical protein D9M69_665490 [compost metagenome]